MSAGRRALLLLPLIAALAACTGGGSSESGGSASASSSAGTSTPPSSAPSSSRSQPSAQGSGASGSEPSEAPGFPADTSPDGGPAQAGATSDPSGQMHVAGIRYATHQGYVRVVIDLNTAGIPEWTARYTDKSGPGGGPVDIQGDAFLRISLKTNAEPGGQGSSSTSVSPGPVAAVKTTGFFEGYEEVLIGMRGGEQPFRAFALTDPGRIVIDVPS